MRQLWSIACIATAALFSAGCSSIPFEPVERVSLVGVDAEDARLRFAESVPTEFELLTSVVFEYWGHEISALGAVAVDAGAGEFHLACITPVGMKLFEISGSPAGTQCDFAIEGFLDRFAEDDQFAVAVGNDVRAIYLDVAPPPDAEVDRDDDDELVFRSGPPESRTEHVFAGADAVLVEKRLYDADDDLTTCVRLFEYRWHDGKAYPSGAVLDNERYGYRLIVRIKEILED